MYDQENIGLLYDWDATYESTYAYKGFLGAYRLMTTDVTAITYILSHSDGYQKPDFVHDNLAIMVAGDEGVLTTEAKNTAMPFAVIKHQRTPAFTAAHITTLTPIFWEIASELRDIWTQLSNEDSKRTSPIDVLTWLLRATLDVMGARKASTAHHPGDMDPLVEDIHEHITATELRQLMARLQLIDEQKTTMAADVTVEWNGKLQIPVSPREPERQDLLSVFVQSNMASFASQRMTTSEVLCQISTFLIAGYETASSALTWCLCSPAKAPECQNSLRDALRTISPESLALHDDVAKLEYLDWVVRETLRLHAPVTWTMWVAMEDGEIPVRRPFCDMDEKLNTVIKIARRDIITIPIQAVNKSKSIWGEDAYVFRVKAFLFTLVGDLEFSIDSSVIIKKTLNVVARPVVNSESTSGNNMPLFIGPASPIRARPP
ncbi:cytochrome P450 [Gyrodon lividus]|nr:cytochrome P450 [Gyrodon lividus]